MCACLICVFFFQAEDGIRDGTVTGVQTCALPISIGPASSVQDGGRHGAQRYGLTPSGAMDRFALATANSLVGNAAFAAAIEIGPFGGKFTAREGAVRIALAVASRNG